MATMKRRDLEAAMPPEVRRRLRSAGKEGKIDWYAGREHVSTLRTKSDAEVKKLKLGDRQIPDGGRRRSRGPSGPQRIVEAVANAIGAVTGTGPALVRRVVRGLSTARH